MVMISLVFSLFWVSLLIGAQATPTLTSKYARSNKIEWTSCQEEGIEGFKCGSLTVPLDYTDPSSDQTLDLQVLKIDATKTPKKGSILFNFGGPGLEARFTLAAQAELFISLTGGQYDLLAHDPRGTANTLTFSCFETPEERAGNTSNSNLNEYSGPQDEVNLGKLWTATAMFNEICHEHPGSKKTGSLIGTAFTSRDLMQIVDAVEDDGLLRYWGFSYGTALGATVSAMFPDRVDKVILDGVQNPHEYFNAYDVETFADSDFAFSQFLKECIKAPDECALSHNNSTAAAFDLERNVYNLLQDLRRQPLVVNGSIIDSNMLRETIRFGLYSPGNFPILSLILNSLLTGDLADVPELMESLTGGITGALSENDAPFGIHCADKKTELTTLEQLMPVFRTSDQTSRLFGTVTNGLDMICSQWKFEAKERYTGDFKAKTRRPLLLIGNSYDSATPIRSAYNVSSGFEGSVVLENGGFGHGSISHGSVCTGNAIRNYFKDGTLPAPRTVCEVDYPPFTNKTWADVLPKLDL